MTRTLHLEVVLPFHGSIALASWPSFKESDFPVFVEGRKSLRLRFDASSAAWATRFTDDELKNLTNPRLHSMFAEVTVTDISEDLAKWMSTTKSSHEPQHFAEAYRALADEIFDLIVNHANRLIAFVRAQKGQYWIEEYELLDGKDLHNLGDSPNQVRTKARFDDDSEWFSWYPPFHPITIVVHTGENSRFLSIEDWQHAWQFVSSQRNTDLVLELLVNAESLHRNGHERSAVTEAITALEVALHRFAKNPQSKRILSAVIDTRFGIEKVEKIVSHLGFSTSLSLLLPLIFSEEELSSELLRTCRDALDQRNNVVHNGQRSVSNLSTMLDAIRMLSKFLAQSDASGQTK
jgi:hypothetical protein